MNRKNNQMSKQAGRLKGKRAIPQDGAALARDIAVVDSAVFDEAEHLFY